jgi:threonine dehydratase
MLSYEDILEARDRMHPEIFRTPLQVWRHGSTASGKLVQLKLETLQRTGSFKARGAWNRLRLLSPQERKTGVLCVSAGNHAQGVSLASYLLGIQATIVMPRSTPEIKIKQTKLYGQPEVILHGENLSQAFEFAAGVQRERNLIFIHPYDDDAVIAGQGTIGLEIVEQWPDVDTILVSVGGGGLISGIATALQHRRDVKIIGVQAKGADSAYRSLQAGRRIRVPDAATCADGINVAEIGERAFRILQNGWIPILTVTEDEIKTTVTALCQTAKLVVEPAGAAAAAPVIFSRGGLKRSRRVVCVLSGANVNLSAFADILTSHRELPS